VVILYPFIPKVFSERNFYNIMSNTWPLLAVAIGQTFVLIVAGIDLSQPSIMALTSVIGGAIMTSELNPTLFSKSPLWGIFLSEKGSPLAGSIWAVPIGILAMLIVGAFIGFINGVSVAIFKMPPFMVTLVSMMFFSAFAIYLPKTENIMGLPNAFIAICKTNIWIIPIFSMLIAGVVAILAYFILSRTVFGRWLYATGVNLKASMISGVPTKRVILLAYVISGICAAVGSILYSSRLRAGRPTLGSNLLLDIVGANVIGGNSLFGGKGKVTWTLFGVLFFVFLANTLNLLNLDSFTIDMVKGGVILLAALFDVTRTRILAART
jgi:ribose/xylose/arabinose/galactoside ABC-type transport system permease subunit